MDGQFLGLPELVQGQDVFGVGDRQPLDLQFRVHELLSNDVALNFDVRQFGFAFLLKLVVHPIDNLIRNIDGGQDSVDLLRHVLFANKRLRAAAHLLGTAKIVVTLLRFDGHDASAFTATEYFAIGIGLENSGMVSALAADDLLNTIKQRLADERLMRAMIDFAVVTERAVVDGVPQQAVILRPRQRHILLLFFRLRGQAHAVDRGGETVQRAVALGEEFESFPNEWASLRINDDASLVAIVDVTDWGNGWPDAVSDFLPLATPDVLREVVDVILALCEERAEHELTGRRHFKIHERKLEPFELARVCQIDDAAAVDTVSRETVGVPSEDAFGFALFNTLEHPIKDRATWPLRGLPLREYLLDGNVLSPGKVLKLGDLVLDGT